MSELNSWDIVDANNNAPPPDGWPENTMQYSEVNNTGRAVQGTLKRYFADVNGSLQAAGVADAYTVTLNETGYLAYFQGMYFACEIQATNTGASTIDVNGIGVQTIVDRAGTPLAAGEIQAGGIYEFRYDGTNFQVMGTLAGTATTSDLILTNSNDPDLVDTDVALNVGATDPTSAQHVEHGPSDIQSKSNATTAAALDLNALGGNVNAGAQSGTGVVTLFSGGFATLITEAGGANIRGVAAGDPTVPDAITAQLLLQSSDPNLYGSIGFQGTTALEIESEVEGGLIQLSGEQAGGGAATLLQGDPDGAVTLYHDSVAKVITQSPGVIARGSVAAASPPTTEAVDTRVTFESLNGVANLGLVGYETANDLSIRNNMRGGEIFMRGTAAAGGAQNLLFADPDGDVELFYQGGSVTRTIAGASGGLEANNTLTGGGFERVLTASDLVVGGSAVTVIRKTANEAVNNSTTEQQDNQLNNIALVSGQEYVVEAELRFQPNTNTMGMKASFILAAGSWNQRSWNATQVTNNVTPHIYAVGGHNTTIQASVVPALTYAVSTHIMRIKAYLTTTTAATLELRWAQNTAIVSNLNLLAGSYMKVTAL